VKTFINQAHTCHREVPPDTSKTRQFFFSYLRDENVLHHTSKEETHVAILGVTVVIAFSLATCGAFSVSSTAECLKDSELVRKDTELRLNIPEVCVCGKTSKCLHTAK
jgi:hypothetical protein